MLDKLWKCGEEKINPIELKNNWLLAKDKNGQTADTWQQDMVVREILKWGERTLNPDVLKNNCFLAKYVDRLNAFFFEETYYALQIE
jgi:hypothetical protein